MSELSAPRPGPRNSITDVPGLTVGQAEDRTLTTGVTVILPAQPAVAAVDHRGGGIGSRDTAVLAPGSLVQECHGICLSGGSAFGLDAAGGVMDVLRRQGRGFAVGAARVPIVPSAIIFDLLIGDAQVRDQPPWWDLGRAAAEAASLEFSLGNHGAGLGATAGPLKGGVGTASYVGAFGVVGALAVANPVGGTVIPGTDAFHAWALEEGGEFGGVVPPAGHRISRHAPAANEMPGGNTTLVVVATDASLTRDAALRVAIMAQDGLARAIRPVHAPMDGDTVFVLSTGAAPAPEGPAALATLGALAADAAARAICRGVYEAETLGGYPSYRSRHMGVSGV